MSSLEKRVASIVPQLPAESVVEAFRLGASIGDVMSIAGLSGPALAKAKLRLGSLRQEALRESTGPDPDTLREIMQELSWVRSADVLRDAIAQQYRFGELLVASSDALASLCLEQQDLARQLEAINVRIMHVRRSSLIGAKSQARLIADHQACVASLRANFSAMRKVAALKSRTNNEGTSFHERLLFLGGCSIDGAH